MGRVVARRLLTVGPLWVACAASVFVLMRLAPGDPAVILAGSGASQEEVRVLRDELGLDRPLGIQFLGWFGRVLGGDLGVSYASRDPVLRTLGERFLPTLQLTLSASLISVLLGVPIGTWAALRPRRWLDRVLMGLTATALAVPSFLVAIALIFIFPVYLDLLPLRGYASLGDGPAAWLRHITLPAMTYGLILGAIVTRMTRSAMLEALRQDYINTARSKGLSELAVVGRHALKNSLIPVVTVVGLNFGTLLASAVVVETIFGIPGIGSQLVQSILQRDYPVVQGIVLLVVTCFLVLNLLVDLAYAVLDPRIRYE